MLQYCNAAPLLCNNRLCAVFSCAVLCLLCYAVLFCTVPFCFCFVLLSDGDFCVTSGFTMKMVDLIDGLGVSINVSGVELPDLSNLLVVPVRKWPQLHFFWCPGDLKIIKHTKWAMATFLRQAFLHGKSPTPHSPTWIPVWTNPTQAWLSDHTQAYTSSLCELIEGEFRQVIKKKPTCLLHIWAKSKISQQK